MALNHYLSLGDKNGRTAPLMELNQIALKLGFKHHTVAVWTDRTLSRRTAWGSWLNASSPYIQCLLPNSDIITDMGYKKINEITEGTLVRTHKGTFKKVNVVQKKLYSGDLIKIKYHYNISEEIGCTPEHSFYVRTRSTFFNAKGLREYQVSEPEWISANEIVKGQIKNYGRKGEKVYLLAYPKNKSNKIKGSDFLDTSKKKLWPLIGLFLANGNLNKSKIRGNWRIYITCHTKKRENSIKIIREAGINCSSIYEKENTVRFEINNKSLWLFLVEFFEPGAIEIKGTKAHLKIIPEWCQDLPKSYIKDLICGYFLGDGNIYKKRKISGYSINSVSKKLLYSVQRLLFKIDLYPVFSLESKEKKRVISGKTTNCKKCYKIYWYDKPTYFKKIFEDDDYIWFPIKDIIKDKVIDVEVWDLNVSTDSSYCVNNIVTHNSPFEGILILYKDQWKKAKKGISDISREDFMQLTGGIWDMHPETRGITPANFCLDLPLKCIRLLSYVDSVVLDPFFGGGTVGVASIMTSRKYIGIELSEVYCKLADIRCKEVYLENETF
jgi:hypothetical protein